MLKIAILASGSGTNAQVILDKARAGILDVEIGVIISNNPGAKVLERAEAAEVPHLALDHRGYAERSKHDLALADIILDHGCQAVILAGYMRLLCKKFLSLFKNNVLNIHPAILPSFPGVHGAADALDYGVKLTGPTVHFVDEKMDNGPIIIQAAVPVRQDDTEEILQNRIHALEYRIYPQAIQWLAHGRLQVEGRRVNLKQAPAQYAKIEDDMLVWPRLEEGF